MFHFELYTVLYKNISGIATYSAEYCVFLALLACSPSRTEMKYQQSSLVNVHPCTTLFPHDRDKGLARVLSILQLSRTHNPLLKRRDERSCENQELPWEQKRKAVAEDREKYHCFLPNGIQRILNWPMILHQLQYCLQAPHFENCLCSSQGTCQQEKNDSSCHFCLHPLSIFSSEWW